MSLQQSIYDFFSPIFSRTGPAAPPPPPPNEHPRTPSISSNEPTPSPSALLALDHGESPLLTAARDNRIPSRAPSAHIDTNSLSIPNQDLASYFVERMRTLRASHLKRPREEDPIASPSPSSNKRRRHVLHSRLSAENLKVHNHQAKKKRGRLPDWKTWSTAAQPPSATPPPSPPASSMSSACWTAPEFPGSPLPSPSPATSSLEPDRVASAGLSADLSASLTAHKRKRDEADTGEPSRPGKIFKPTLSPLERLPQELLDEIAANLEYTAHLRVCASSRTLRGRIPAASRRDAAAFAAFAETQFARHADRRGFACFVCNRVKPRGEFADKQTGKDYGKGTRRGMGRFCLECGLKDGERRRYQAGNRVCVGGKEGWACGGCWSVKGAPYCTRCCLCGGCVGADEALGEGWEEGCMPGEGGNDESKEGMAECPRCGDWTMKKNSRGDMQTKRYKRDIQDDLERRNELLKVGGERLMAEGPWREEQLMKLQEYAAKGNWYREMKERSELVKKRHRSPMNSLLLFLRSRGRI